MRCFLRLVVATLPFLALSLATNVFAQFQFSQPPVASYETTPEQRADLESLRPPESLMPQAPPPITGELFEAGEVLAMVGDQYILAADVIPHVNQVLASVKGRIPPEALKEQRRALIAQLTRSHIETKLLYLSFLRKVPPDKIKEIHKKVDKTFNEELEDERLRAEKIKDRSDQEELVKRSPQIGRVVLLMKERGAWTQRELDAILREFGGTLAQEKQFYTEHKLGRAVLSQKINFQPEITYDMLLRYYGEHENDYVYRDRARFEVLTVRLANFNSADEAFNALASMGNEVYYGANFAAVAKRSSQGLNAEQGGYHDWTPRGSLVSKSLDEALFSLEPGKLSPILQDERGLYIVRVLDRQEAGRTPLEQVQEEIREKVRKETIQKQYEQVLADMKQGIPITTAFDDDPLLRQAVRPETSKKK